MSSELIFSKNNLDSYLKAVAKEYRKRNRLATHVELILVGGASVLINYGFREMTTDIDAIIMADSIMKEAINAVGDRFNLPSGWINTEFRNTASYSDKLVEHSEYYKTFSNIVEIRTVKAEYLIAMKLVAGRRYKKDLSDIVGILNEQQKCGNPITYTMIDKAMIELYGGWGQVNNYSKEILDASLASEDLDELFTAVMDDESYAKRTVTSISKKYPDLIKEDNVSDIIAKAITKKDKNSF